MTQRDDDYDDMNDLREMLERFQGPDSPAPSRGGRRRFAPRLALAASLLVVGGVVSAVTIDRHQNASPPPKVKRVALNSCVSQLLFDKRAYAGGTLGPSDRLRRGNELGSGVIPGCNDVIGVSVSKTGTTTTIASSMSADQPVKVFAVFGIDPANAVMVDGKADLIYLSDALSDRINGGACRNSHDISTALRCLGLIPR